MTGDHEVDAMPIFARTYPETGWHDMADQILFHELKNRRSKPNQRKVASPEHRGVFAEVGQTI
jgi:hypothetical protein